MSCLTPTIKLDSERIRRAMRSRGFKSVQSLADSLGLHRNTVGNYLTGKTGFPEALGPILAALNLDPAEVITLQRPFRQVPALPVAGLLDELLRAQPTAAFVLFGSRARGTAKPFSDYDLGIFCPNGLSFRDYSRLLDLVASWNDGNLTEAQLVDLGKADENFLEAVAPDLLFLCGSMNAWCDLLRKAGLELHE